MNEESHNDLFGIKINDDAKKFIRKTYPLVSISFILNILFTIIFIFVSVYNFRENTTPRGNTILHWYVILYPFYTIIYSVIAAAGGYYYFLYLR